MSTADTTVRPSHGPQVWDSPPFHIAQNYFQYSSGIPNQTAVAQPAQWGGDWERARMVKES